jgi:hypothetical protein
LTRNNLLAAYSSQKVVELTGQGSIRVRRSAELVTARVNFDEREFSIFCANRKALYAGARAQIKGRKLEIDYVEARTDAGMARIADFLEIDPKDFRAAKTVKRNSDDILSRFENAAEVSTYLHENALQDWATEK